MAGTEIGLQKLRACTLRTHPMTPNARCPDYYKCHCKKEVKHFKIKIESTSEFSTSDLLQKNSMLRRQQAAAAAAPMTQQQPGTTGSSQHHQQRQRLILGRGGCCKKRESHCMGRERCARLWFPPHSLEVDWGGDLQCNCGFCRRCRRCRRRTYRSASATKICRKA